MRRSPQPRRRRAGSRARESLLALLREPARTHELLRRLLGLPLGARDLPLVFDCEVGRPLLLCRLPPGAGPAWCLLDVVLGRGEARWPWARTWLEAAERTGQRGHLVVLTDSEDVAGWVRRRPFRARYGIEVSPRVLLLSTALGALLSPEAPRLAPLALWAARRWPAPERTAILARAVHLSQALPEGERRRQVASLLDLFARCTGPCTGPQGASH